MIPTPTARPRPAAPVTPYMASGPTSLPSRLAIWTSTMRICQTAAGRRTLQAARVAAARAEMSMGLQHMALVHRVATFREATVAWPSRLLSRARPPKAIPGAFHPTAWSRPPTHTWQWSNKLMTGMRPLLQHSPTAEADAAGDSYRGKHRCLLGRRCSSSPYLRCAWCQARRYETVV